MRLAERKVSNILLDVVGDRRLVTAHVSGDRDIASTTISVGAVFDRSDDLVCPDGWRSNRVGFALTGKRPLSSHAFYFLQNCP